MSDLLSCSLPLQSFVNFFFLCAQNRNVGIAVASLVVFGGAEETLHTLLGQSVGVAKIWHCAVYLLPAQIILGLSSYNAFERYSGQRVSSLITVAFLVMIFYVGAAVSSYFFFEKVLVVNKFL